MSQETLNTQELTTLKTGLNFLNSSFVGAKIGGENNYYQKSFQPKMKGLWVTVHKLLSAFGEDGFEYNNLVYSAHVAQKGSPYINRISKSVSMFNSEGVDEYDQMVNDSIAAQQAYRASKSNEEAPAF